MDELIKIRDIFIETADILDQIIALEEKENAGEDIKTEIEILMGRFYMKTMQMQELQK